MTLAALLLAALGAAPATGTPTAPDTSPVAPARAATLVVRARGLDDVALQAALRPRSGGAAVVLLRDVASVDPDHTFVDVDLQAPELAITIILRDGRVFVRRARGGGPRDAARLIASMLAAIEGDALAPLPERAVSPALAEAPPEPVPEDMPEQPAEDPAAAVPLPPAPPPEPAPQDMSASPAAAPEPVAPAPAGPPPKPVPKASPLQLDLGLGGGPLFGLGVPDAGVRGGAGELRLELRGGRPWLIAAGLRGAGHILSGTGPESREEQFGLVRVRVSLGAGSWLVRGRFELRATANLTVEPWLVTHAGARVRLGESVDPAPLLGGLVRIVPSFAVTRRLQIGVFAELAASAAPTGNAVRIGVEDRRLFSMGGPEVSFGVELRARLWSKQTKQRSGPQALDK